MYLSPCLIAIVLISIYILMDQKNQSKIKSILNKNQNILIGILVAGTLWYIISNELPNNIQICGKNTETNE